MYTHMNALLKAFSASFTLYTMDLSPYPEELRTKVKNLRDSLAKVSQDNVDDMEKKLIELVMYCRLLDES